MANIYEIFRADSETAGGSERTNGAGDITNALKYSWVQ